MTTENTIPELVEAYLSDNHNVRVVEFADGLLALVAEAGPVTCRMAGDDNLHFQVEGQPRCEVPLGRARAKLRMLCARLAVLCNESGDQDVSIYGGEGVIRRLAADPPEELKGADAPTAPAAALDRAAQVGAVGLAVPPVGSRRRPTEWTVRFMNTPSEHHFTIHAV
jgi:hypothetical protein